MDDPKRSVQLWMHLMQLNWRATTVNRVDFVLGNMSVLLHSLATAITLGLLFYAGSGLRGWSTLEWLYYLGLAMLSRAIWDTLFIGMLDISHLVRGGGLDEYRARPLSTLFLVSTSRFDVDTWGELLFGVLLVGTGLRAPEGLVIPIKIAVTVVSVFFGVVIFYALHLLSQAASFWVQDNWAFTFVLWRLDGTTTIPASFYPFPIFIGLSFLVPLAFVNYYPAAFIFSKAGGNLFWLQPVVALLVCIVAAGVWRRGLRRYAGAG